MKRLKMLIPALLILMTRLAMADLQSIPLKDIDGKDTSLKAYGGKVLLVVNVASKCSLTPQYKALQELQDKYKDKGFTVLAFPCNQFGAQEPEGEAKIGEFCASVFGATFPLFAKVDVNGPDAHPLFDYLKHEMPGLLGTERIKWNFTKFLVGRDGKVVARYAPITAPGNIEKPIEKLL